MMKTIPRHLAIWSGRMLRLVFLPDTLFLFALMSIVFDIKRSWFANPWRQACYLAAIFLAAVVFAQKPDPEKRWFKLFRLAFIAWFFLFDSFYFMLAWWSAPEYFLLQIAAGLVLLLAAWPRAVKAKFILFLCGTALLLGLPFALDRLTFAAALRFYPAYLGILVGGFLVLSFGSVRTLWPSTLAVLAMSLTLLPLESMHYISLSGAQRRAILAQPDVTRLFDNGEPQFIPQERKEFLCDSRTGKRIVTPHAPDRTVAVFRPDGRLAKMELASEAANRSILLDGFLYTVVDGEMQELDLAAETVRRSVRVFEAKRCGYNLSVNAEGTQLGLIQDTWSDCVLFSLDDFQPRERLPIGSLGECVPLKPPLVLLSDNYWFFFRRLRLMDRTTGQIMRQAYSPNFGFRSVTVDYDRRLIYTVSTHPGKIQLFALDTLAPQGSFPTVAGACNVLLDPRRPDRLFSFSYSSGEVFEHALPGGGIRHRWVLGPILRNLAWDCDGRGLLGVSNQGGFRIHLED